MADNTAVLQQLMQGAGLTPGTRGQGFADVPYWNDISQSAGLPYVQQRLGADLKGTGPDQSTGTPMSGLWDQSGGSSPSVPGGAPPPMNAAPPGGNQADQILAQVEGNVNDQVRQLLNGGANQSGTGI